MNLKFYDYLKDSKIKKHQQMFIVSTTSTKLVISQELEEYIKGGADNDHKQLREGYGHIPKPQARKIKIICMASQKMRGGTVMTDDLGDEKQLNNETTHINRGFELLPRQGGENQNRSKLFR